MTKQRILIATGIYPPDIGGPAEYAYNLEQMWKKEGKKVTVKYYSFERDFPTGFRHAYFLLKSLWAALWADYILVLDTWSAAFPTAVLCMLLGRKFVIRTGGDFLWESYVERTRKKVLFRSFYFETDNFTRKEKFIFKWTKWILSKAEKVVFSTEWQRTIWQAPYGLDMTKTAIIENFYGEKEPSIYPVDKAFVGATRPLVWKNTSALREIFQDARIEETKCLLDINPAYHKDFLNKIKESYAVILISLGDISPNTILDAIRCNKPFIVTEENGIKERIKDTALFVNPLDKDDIIKKILWLADDANYKTQCDKVRGFNFIHSWEEIGAEFLNIKLLYK